MSRYRVTWTIDIEGDDINTLMQAAIETLRIQREPGSIATVFEVAKDGGGDPVRFDLATGLGEGP